MAVITHFDYYFQSHTLHRCMTDQFFLQNSGEEEDISGSLQNTVQSFILHFICFLEVSMCICTGGWLDVPQTFSSGYLPFSLLRFSTVHFRAARDELIAQILSFVNSICALDSYTHLQNFLTLPLILFITFLK